jgi:hypothetical protein
VPAAFPSWRNRGAVLPLPRRFVLKASTRTQHERRVKRHRLDLEEIVDGLEYKRLEAAALNLSGRAAGARLAVEPQKPT